MVEVLSAGHHWPGHPPQIIGEASRYEEAPMDALHKLTTWILVMVGTLHSARILVRELAFLVEEASRMFR